MKPEAQEEKESSTTVKFNVGGKIYEISKSLLAGFPDTMLAEKAKQSSSFPIFIDRDPDRFSFCLDYMRDNGNVYLPEMVSKRAVLEDLKFFGVGEIDETKIVCDENSQDHFMTRFHKVKEASKRRIEKLEQCAATLQNDAQALQQAVDALKSERDRRNEEIKMEKIAMKCLAASFESDEDRFLVDYRDVSYIRRLHLDQYFIARCEKLGLRVDGPGNKSSSFQHVQVFLTRKSNTEGQK